MSSLNLHLDFMNEPERPIRYIELSAEEELQIIEDSNKLLRQIDEDCRVLDGMCSALENLFIIQRHYEEFGSSPALEALVGDIHEVLGISVEVEEAESEGDGEKKKGGGIGGAIGKVWDWIVNIFRRIGEWLNIVDKKVDADKASLDETLKDTAKLSNYYTIKYIKGLYDGQTVKQPINCNEIESLLLKAIERAGFGGGEHASAVEIDNIAKKFAPYQELTEGELQGKDIKLLSEPTYKLYKGTHGIVVKINKKIGKGEDAKSKIEMLKEDIGSKIKQNDEQGQSYMNNPLEELNHVVKKSIPIIKLVSHRSAISISSMIKASRAGDGNKNGTKVRSEEDVNKEKQDRADAAAQAKQEQEAAKEKAKQEAAEKRHNK